MITRTECPRHESGSMPELRLVGLRPKTSLAKQTPSDCRNHQGMAFRSLQNLPVSSWGASDASQTIPLAPSPTERVAFDPPMSVRTQPGQTELTANFGKAAASCEV